MVDMSKSMKTQAAEGACDFLQVTLDADRVEHEIFDLAHEVHVKLSRKGKVYECHQELKYGTISDLRVSIMNMKSDFKEQMNG